MAIVQYLWVFLCYLIYSKLHPCEAGARNFEHLTGHHGQKKPGGSNDNALPFHCANSARRPDWSIARLMGMDIAYYLSKFRRKLKDRMKEFHGHPPERRKELHR